MLQLKNVGKIQLSVFDAYIFDLDGVVTNTAKIHALAWKKTFDDFLAKRSSDQEDFVPFEIKTDYVQYVDGMPRYDGVKNFLKSRNIILPYGEVDDPPDRETVCGVGNKKNKIFQGFLTTENIQVYDATIDLIQILRQHGIKTAIVSSSKNCAAILELVQITHLFDVKVDGVDSKELGLTGKPAPDIFLSAAQKLGVKPRRAVVVEDAISGVMAGRRGKFGLVIGINRADNAEKLKSSGADIVVSDLAEVLTEI